MIYFHVFSPISCSYMDIYLLVFVRICQYMLVFKARKSVSRINTSIYVQNVHILTRYKQKYCKILAKTYRIRTLFLRFQKYIFIFDVRIASICTYFSLKYELYRENTSIYYLDSICKYICVYARICTY